MYIRCLCLLFVRPGLLFCVTSRKGEHFSGLHGREAGVCMLDGFQGDQHFHSPHGGCVLHSPPGGHVLQTVMGGCRTQCLCTASCLQEVIAYTGPKNPFYEVSNPYVFLLFKQPSMANININPADFSTPFFLQNRLATFIITYALAG